jgi:hypothetical protein
MSIIRPPISGDSPQDSWANQVTEAINKGLLGPSVNPSAAAVIGVGSFSAATVYLYTRTITASPPAAIAQDLTYDYSQAAFTTSPPFGSANWETSPPGTVNGDYLWVTTVNISANVAQEIIPFSSWSTPTIFSVNGQSSIVVNAFKRATSSPSTPTGGSYSFTTQTLTPPSGWSASIPSGTDPVYISTAIATVSGTSGVDSSLTWSAAVKMVENGTDGDAGPELESGLVYYTTPQASNPGTPSATNYNFSTGAFTGLTSGWQTNPVTVNITTTTALFWSSKFRINQGPDDANPTIVFNTPIPSVNFGTNIQSDNYITGSSGWQIRRASGDAEFNNIDVRGGVIADSVVANAIASNSITADKINVTDLSAISANLGTIQVDTANIADSAITNAKIVNAAITTAKINDLAVDTIKIADQAVTIPSFEFTLNPVSNFQNTFSVTTTGAPLILNVSFVGTGNTGLSFNVRFFQNNTVFTQRVATTNTEQQETFSFEFYLTPSAGTQLFGANLLKSSGTGNYSWTNLLFTAVEFKK